MVGQGECAGFTFFGGCCGELLRGGTRGRPRAASRRPRHGCTTNARQTDSLFSLARSLGVKQSTFFFLNFKYLTTRDFYSQGSETLHFKCRGEEMEISVAEKFQHFPELVECSWLYRAHGRRRSSTKQKKKTRRWRGFLRLGGRPWPAAERGFRLHTRGPAAGLKPSPPRRAASRLGAPLLTFEEAKPPNTLSVPTGRWCSFWHSGSWSRRSRGW